MQLDIYGYDKFVYPCNQSLLMNVFLLIGQMYLFVSHFGYKRLLNAQIECRSYRSQATVRLLVNYRKSHKTVVRVSPRVPLEDLVSAIGQKCEFPPASTALLRDAQTQEPLDLSKSLNDLGIRELFAKDTAGEPLERFSGVH